MSIVSLIYSIWKWIHSLLTRLVLATLSAGPIPKHLAFVLDGNRRFAREKGQQVVEGHAQGFESLKRVLELCLRLDVECVTVYVFSIENFSRPKDEVDALMDMARGRFRELADKGALLDRYGVRVNMIGQVSLLPPDVRNSVREMEELTKHNSRAVLNVCMPYTSRDEITTAVNSCIQNCVSESRPLSEITSASIDQQLFTSLVNSPPLDILVRTSGVHRLSDFLLWQCNEDTYIQFVDTYWPVFGAKDMIPILLEWQGDQWRKNWRRKKRKGRSLDTGKEEMKSR